MIRVFAKWWAKKQYIWKQEVEAATAELHAGLSLKLAAEKRAQIVQLNKEADDIEANIKAVDERLETGYFECENGHEPEVVRPSHTSTDNLCPVCDAKVKWASRANMTGQEKYDADKERTETQTIAREQARPG